MKRMTIALILLATSACDRVAREPAPGPVALEKQKDQQRKAAAPTREDRQAVLDGMMANVNVPLGKAEEYARANGLTIPPGMVATRKEWDASHSGEPRRGGGSEFLDSPFQPKSDK